MRDERLSLYSWKITVRIKFWTICKGPKFALYVLNQAVMRYRSKDSTNALYVDYQLAIHDFSTNMKM